MSDYFIYVLIAIIVIVGVWFIFAKVLKNKKPKEVTLKDIPIDLDQSGRFRKGKKNSKARCF